MPSTASRSNPSPKRGSRRSRATRAPTPPSSLRTRAGAGAIPATVRDAVLARAGRLSEAARNLLEAVPVAPPHVDVPLLDALAGEDAGTLDEGLAAGVLAASPTTGGFGHGA